MSVVSNIEWTDSSWNPVSGCTQISPGCAHCYALTFAERFRGVPGNYYEKGFDLQLRPSQLEKPLHWKKPRRIFVNSMSDLFHEDVPDEYIDRVFAVMALTPQHTYQLLTKRIERAQAYLADEDVHQLGSNRISAAALKIDLWPNSYEDGFLQDGNWPLPNVLVGPTVENQAMAHKRLDATRELRAMGWRTMVSYEPALTAVNFEPWADAMSWLICGGESGPGARPFNVEWARSALSQARDAAVPFFMKQLGGHHPGSKLEDLPEDLRVREFPR